MGGGMGMSGRGQAEQEAGVFVVVAISLLQDGEYLVELVPEERLRRKPLKERWELHDNFYGDPDALPSFLSRKLLPPLSVPLSASEFSKLNLHVGEQVRLAIEPIGI